MRQFTVTLITAAFVGTACVPLSRRTDLTVRSDGTSEDRAELFVRAAQTMGHRGNYLDASYFLEAALQEGAPETRVLPLLIGAQMRSGRLRAAAKSLGRLKEIQSDRPYLEELESLIERFDSAAYDESAGRRTGLPDSASNEVTP